MAITKMASYDLKDHGTKLSFAEWISNLSPTETPFCSMVGKESIKQTTFQWQTDVMPPVKADNAVLEGSVPDMEDPASTALLKNYTQIFRNTVSISDTANAVQSFGRGREVGYQMQKAGLEFKRDMEVAFLQYTGVGSLATSGNKKGKTAGFVGLCATKAAADGDTGATTHKETAVQNTVTEAEIFDMTYQLYLANSKANIVMFHPKHAGVFSKMLSADTTGLAGNRMKMFKAMDDTYNTEVDTLIDPLGQKFALVPNRHMPENMIYFFNPSDWTQMVLRAPKTVQLAKVGSSEEWMIEAEIGLRHRNKHASGVLELKA